MSGSYIEYFGLAALFAFGLVFGSFANVVIWRYPRGESLSSPPSHCPACNHPIRWRDNIPVVSWIVLRGRCRDCDVRISPRYPLVELLSGALWVVAGYAFGLTPMTVTAVFLFYMLLVLAAIDLDTMRLPNGLVMLLAAVGYFAALANQVTGVGLAPLATVDSGIFAAPLVAAAAGSLTAGGLSWGIAALYQGVRGRSGLGMGDVKLLLALGPYLGVYTILVLFVGSLIGAVAGIALARNRSQGLAAKIPFGPYLAIGAIVTALGGVPMVRWYMTLLGS